MHGAPAWPRPLSHLSHTSLAKASELIFHSASSPSMTPLDQLPVTQSTAVREPSWQQYSPPHLTPGLLEHPHPLPATLTCSCGLEGSPHLSPALQVPHGAQLPTEVQERSFIHLLTLHGPALCQPQGHSDG